MDSQNGINVLRVPCMSQSESPLDRKSLGRCDLKELLDGLASNAIIPGAGTAGGVALALAAACAGKAVAITLLHDADNRTLNELQQELAALRESALALAEADALLFRQHLKYGDPQVAEQLLRTDHQILSGCRQLDVLLEENAGSINATMRGDWLAAKALITASRLIQQANVRELTR